MKYIIVKYVKEIEHCDLDLVNKDALFHYDGDDYEEHDYIPINEAIAKYVPTWQQDLDIDTMIETLKELKKLGSNYVQVMYHTDHMAYLFYGIEKREATHSEVEKYLSEFKKDKNEGVEKAIKFHEEKIKELKSELE